MSRKGYEEVVIYVGTEAEHTPAFSKKTLFVVGLQFTKDIEALAQEHKATHIFLGANYSFDASKIANKSVANLWNEQITYFLDLGYWVSLSYPAHQHKDILEAFTSDIWQSKRFVPVLSVKIPKIQTSNPNLTVKIDDTDFDTTNPGVWCMHYHEVTDSNRFTGWNEYVNDEIVKVNKLTMEGIIKEHFGKKVKTDPDNLQSKEVINISSANAIDITGLDPNSISMLKPETDEKELNKQVQVKIKSVEDAAAMYAEGATVDSIGMEATKKARTKAKKAQ